MDCVEKLIKKDMLDPINSARLKDSDIIPLQRVKFGSDSILIFAWTQGLELMPIKWLSYRSRSVILCSDFEMICNVLRCEIIYDWSEQSIDVQCVGNCSGSITIHYYYYGVIIFTHLLNEMREIIISLLFQGCLWIFWVRFRSQSEERRTSHDVITTTCVLWTWT